MYDDSNDIVFRIGELYRNRSRSYKVLETHGKKLKVEYIDDGSVGELDAETQKRIISNLKKEKPVPGIIDKNRETFFYYVDQCNTKYRLGHDLGLYKEIIDRHRKGVGIDSILDDESFYPLLWNTLEAWNMNQRGAQLTTLENLRNSIRAHHQIINRLYPFKLSSVTEDLINTVITKLLHDLFCELEVMETRRRIVAVSKTMHFLLPDLVIPMDGNYTLSYFYGYGRYDNSAEAEFDTFEDIFLESFKITKRLNLTQADVNNQKWNTSVPKLIDDAIIGFFKLIEP